MLKRPIFPIIYQLLYKFPHYIQPINNNFLFKQKYYSLLEQFYPFKVFNQLSISDRLKTHLINYYNDDINILTNIFGEKPPWPEFNEV